MTISERSSYLALHALLCRKDHACPPAFQGTSWLWGGFDEGRYIAHYTAPMGIRLRVRCQFQSSDPFYRASGLGPNGAAEYHFPQEHVLIGRSSGSDVLLPHESISALHATVYQSDQGYKVVDKGSTNGIWLGGSRLLKDRGVALKTGDTLRLGPFLIECEIDPLISQPTSTQKTNSLARVLLQELMVAEKGESQLARAPQLKVCFQGQERILDLPPSGPFKVGRGEHCDLVLEDPGVSREHLLLTVEEGSVWVEDLESKNALSVNRERTRRIRLCDGDCMCIGRSELYFIDPLDRELRMLEERKNDGSVPSWAGSSSVELGTGDSSPRGDGAPSSSARPHLVRRPEAFVYGLAAVVFLASLLGLFWVLGSGCGSDSGRAWKIFTGQDNTGYGKVVDGSEASSSPEIDARLAQELSRLDTHMSKQGFARLGPTHKSPSLSQHGVSAHTIQARAGVCYVVAAIADPKADLNMVVFDGAGRTLSYNVDPDATPWATFCTGEPGPYTVRLQMARGQSSYYFAAFEHEDGGQADLSGFFGAPAGGGDDLPSAIADRFIDLSLDFRREGLVQVGAPLEAPLGTNEQVSFRLPLLEEGICYGYVGVGADGVRRVEVEILDEKERRIALGYAGEPHATVRACAKRTGPHLLRLRVLEGSGLVYSAGYAPGSGTGDHPENRSASSTLGLADLKHASLKERFRLLEGDLVQVRGYRRRKKPKKHKTERSRTQKLDLSLQGGVCYAFAALGDPSLEELQLSLRGPRGNVVDRDLSETPYAVVRACPAKEATYRAELRVSGSRGSVVRGSYVLSLYKWSRGYKGPFGLQGIEYLRLGELTSVLGVEGYVPDADYTPLRGKLPSKGKAKKLKLRLKKSRCYALVAVGGAGILELRSTLKKGNRIVAKSEEDSASPNLRYCAKNTGSYVFELTPVAGSGSFFVQTFSRRVAKYADRGQ